ncbi:MAG: helix-turn-helix domain-containing protein [Nitrospira sp.]|nr:helix-turn-helix domain-containing protein [Nitrospira sp.]
MSASKSSPANRLLDIETVASWLGISPHTLYKMVSQRRIPYVKVGSRVKFDPLKLEDWIKQQTVMPMPERRP